MADARHRRALVDRHRSQIATDLAHRGDRHVQPVDRAAFIARQFEIYARERRHRAAGAEQPQSAFDGKRDRTERLDDARFHPLIGGDALGRCRQILLFGFGKRDHAPGDADPVGDLRGASIAGPAGQQFDQFGRSAADVEDQCGSVALLEQRVASGDRQPCFLAWVDDVEDDAGFAVDAVDEVAPVLGAAARFGGDCARQMDPAPHQLVRTDAQRRQRTLDRGIAQSARRR